MTLQLLRQLNQKLETKSVHQLILDDEIERFFKEARDGKESRTFTRLRI
ncbi:hypothetical protein [Methanobrevibacter sp.]|nr:hypothetical protein [Methanobrevibacter sp.]MEE0024286.1 hypothetical protein [Methanobrevibacter sp.]